MKNDVRVIINCAVSLDGRLTSLRYLSDKLDFERVYKLRTKVDGLLVGANTINIDNPSLTSKGYGKDPVPIILDKEAVLNSNKKIFERNPIVITSEKTKLEKKKIENLVITNDFSWKNIKKILFEKGIKKILVEGGGKVIRSLIIEKEWDIFFIYYANVFAGNNHVSMINGEINNILEAKVLSVKKLGEGFLVKLKIL
ncbi:MAG: dihydrofolate reductase family protein [Candidatus Woesearchaeota archaeon]